jgi:hypothetical protein
MVCSGFATVRLILGDQSTFILRADNANKGFCFLFRYVVCVNNALQGQRSSFMLEDGRAKSFREIADNKIAVSCLIRVMYLTVLAPDIVADILSSN